MVERFPNFTVYTGNDEFKVQCSYKIKKSYSAASNKPKSVFYLLVACFVFTVFIPFSN